MIHYDTSNDKISKVIVEWCKEKNYLFYFDIKDKERNYNTYPFNIDAPSEAKDELIQKIKSASS